MMNFSMSAFIEILLHRKRIIVCENLGELIIQLSRIGNNINQIAHTANSAKTISNEQIEKVQELMNQVYDQMTRFVDLLVEKDNNLPKSVGIHTGKAISNLADAVRRLEKRMKQIEEKIWQDAFLPSWHLGTLQTKADHLPSWPVDFLISNRERKYMMNSTTS